VKRLAAVACVALLACTHPQAVTTRRASAITFVSAATAMFGLIVAASPEHEGTTTLDRVGDVAAPAGIILMNVSLAAVLACEIALKIHPEAPEPARVSKRE
jgi:hypothetical protein